jgi:thioredoxin 2
MAPQFAEAARNAPDIRFIKVDSDAAPMASQRYGIRSIPTLLLMYQGGNWTAERSDARFANSCMGAQHITEEVISAN